MFMIVKFCRLPYLVSKLYIMFCVTRVARTKVGEDEKIAKRRQVYSWASEKEEKEFGRHIAKAIP